MKNVFVLFSMFAVLCSCGGSGNGKGSEAKDSVEVIGNSDAAMGYTWSEVLQKKVRVFDEGKRILSVTDSADVTAGYVIFSSDSSEAELFLPEETVVLDKRVRSNNEPVWNVEDDDTYQLEFNNDVLLVSRRGTLLYSSCGYGNMINAVFVDEKGKEINAVFHNSENIVELTVDGMNYILKGYITASGYGYACPAYDLRGKGREAVLTNRYDNSSMKLHEK